jgi:hypothetical protein
VKKQDIYSRLTSLANCLDYKDNDELTNEIFNIDWEKYEDAKPILDKYLCWLINPVKFPLESRNETKLYIEKALADQKYDFQGVVDDAEMVFDDTKQNPRKVFEAIYKYICENE